MASPRTRRVLQDLKQSNENSVSESGFINSIFRFMHRSYRLVRPYQEQNSPQFLVCDSKTWHGL